jgi:Cu2+-exporting ATPase
MMSVAPETTSQPTMTAAATAEPLAAAATARELDFADSISSHAGQTRLSMRVPDIRCAACSLKIERRLSNMPHVSRVATNLADKRVVVDFSAGDALGFIEAVEKLGFTPLPDRANLAQAALHEERKSMLARLGVAGIGMMQVMMFALASYVAGPAGIEPAYEGLMRWASLAVATPIAIYSAMPFHLGAWRDVRNFHPGMDVPISLAILAAYCLSLANTVWLDGAVYYDSVCMFAFLLLIGRYVELGSRQKYQLSQNLNDNLLPTSVQIFDADEDHGRFVLVSAVPVGARLVIGPDQVIPVDGIVLRGQASVNESAFTGESLPISKKAGMAVLAGSMNVEGEMWIECTAPYEEFVLTRISALFRESGLYKPRFSQLADRLAGVFVIFILLATAACALYWYSAGSAQWFSIALAVLVVSCPCALSLATPVAYTVAISALRNYGVVVRNGAFLERLAESSDIVFDKTGTLTTGKLHVGRIAMLAANMDDRRVLLIAAALERGSLHPIARAFAGALELQAVAVVSTAGEGVSGLVDGVQYRLGKAEFAFGQPLAAPAETGMWVLLAADVPLAWIQLIDEPRPEASEIVARLQGLGFSLALLTGDAEAEAQRIAGLMAIGDVQAGVTPAEKVAAVQRRQADGGRVVMVGDGINDAAAMASAHASIAVSPVDVVVQEAADATLLTNSLTSLPTLIVFARQVRRVIRQNVSWAIIYNISVIPLAMGGLLQPWMAALGMSVSSLLVVFNANRLRQVQD